MNYEDLVKYNSPIVYKIIKNSLNERLSHAYLFSSHKNAEVINEPNYLIQQIISEPNERRSIESFPDLIVLDGSEKNIPKDEVVAAMEKLYQSPLDKKGVKILLIKNIENASPQSLNSLLKFIEEPTPNTYIIMTTNNLSNVLSTIQSRSQVINVRYNQKEKTIKELKMSGLNEEHATILSYLSNSSDELMKYHSKNFSEDLEFVKDLLNKTISNKYIFITTLNTYVNKTNFTKIFGILKVFFNDIWKDEINLETSFKDKDLILKYVDIKFSYDKAITLINEATLALKSHANFELNLIWLLTELEVLYG